MKVLLANNRDSAGLKVKTLRLRWRIVPFRLTVKRVSTDLSLFDASVTCTQLERNNNFKHSKGTQTMTTPTYNRLNKDDAIVLLVDHQTGLISLVQDFSPNEFKNNVLALADLAKFFELPTILTTSFEQGPNGPLVPELKEMFPDAPYIARPGQINAWDNEDFVKAIKATGRKQIIIAGVVTDVCVAFPTLSALAEGFDVFVVTDASGTFNTTVQQAAWSRMTQAGAQMMNWFSVACELHRDWRNDIEGLGNLLSQRIPNYRNLMNGYSALTAQQK
jgi:nicotinamidase-related amidase